MILFYSVIDSQSGGGTHGSGLASQAGLSRFFRKTYLGLGPRSLVLGFLFCCLLGVGPRFV